MVRYLFEMQISPQAVDTLIKNPNDRAKVMRPLFEALGGKLEEYYMAAGANTVYVVGYLPDEVTLLAINMATFAGGALTSTKATPILTAAEAVEGMKKAADIAYKPPSS
jgi:uncharacterized protein with GYD domain